MAIMRLQHGPGEEMEADAANDGWYYIWLPAWANHVIINANEGNVQTEEQILDTNAAWITVSAADTVEISYESKTTGEAPAYVEKFVVHAKVDDSWDTPCLWAWSAPDGTNAFSGMARGRDESRRRWLVQHQGSGMGQFHHCQCERRKRTDRGYLH